MENAIPYVLLNTMILKEKAKCNSSDQLTSKSEEHYMPNEFWDIKVLWERKLSSRNFLAKAREFVGNRQNHKGIECHVPDTTYLNQKQNDDLSKHRV